MLSKSLECKSHSLIESVLLKAGYIEATKITETLQGSIWRTLQKSTNKHVVIKVTNIDLHKNHMVIFEGQKIKVYENILMENSILKYLSKDKNCPNSIVKYIDSFRSNTHYFVVMEDGGSSFFDFIVTIHEFIKIGKLEIVEWQKLAKIIFKQMIECIDYCHSNNICHFDISLENFLINDFDIYTQTGDIDGKVRFYIDGQFHHNPVQIKLCDFGLAQYFSNKLHPIYSEKGAVNFNKFRCNKYCGKNTYKSPEIINKKTTFDAKKNDIWCLGICLFMMINGNMPWKTASKSDPGFDIIINGGIRDIEHLLIHWKKQKYVNKHLIQLFSSFFKYEEERININTVKKCEWLNQ